MGGPEWADLGLQRLRGLDKERAVGSLVESKDFSRVDIDTRESASLYSLTVS